MGNVSAMLGVLTGFGAVWVVILAGYGAGKANLFGAQGRQVLNTLTFSIATPALLFQTISEAQITMIFGPQAAIAGIGAFTVMGLYLAVTGPLVKRQPAERTIGAVSAGMVNSANLGIPIATFVLGDPAYAVPVLLFQLAFLQPLSLMVLDAQSSHAGNALLGTLKGIATNPMILASVAGVVVSLLGWSVPEAIMNPIEILAGAAVPSMLIAFGISLVGSKPLTKAGERRFDVVLATGFKLILHPILAWVLAVFVFHLDAEGVFMAVILGMLPAAQNVFVMASHYNCGLVIAKDSVLVSTLCGVPLMFACAMLLG